MCLCVCRIHIFICFGIYASSQQLSNRLHTFTYTFIYLCCALNGFHKNFLLFIYFKFSFTSYASLPVSLYIQFIREKKVILCIFLFVLLNFNFFPKVYLSVKISRHFDSFLSHTHFFELNKKNIWETENCETTNVQLYISSSTDDFHTSDVPLHQIRFPSTFSYTYKRQKEQLQHPKVHLTNKRHKREREKMKMRGFCVHLIVIMWCDS